MTKPESYPFLRIAKQFKISYYDLLGMLNDLSDGSGYYVDPRILADKYSMPRERVSDLLREVQAAIHIQHMVRTGKLDWQTGEVRFNGE